jgi:SPP1 gp7 family putative phage head morphogenesis protein
MLPPDGVGLAYAVELSRAFDALFERLLPSFKAQFERADAPSDEGLTIASTVIRALSAKYFRRTADFNRVHLARALGVDIFSDDQALQGLLQAFIIENIDLIQNTTHEFSRSASEIINDAVRRGLPYRSVADDIQERLNIAKRHARVIARDQIGKAYGDITKHRQEEIGITSYIWRTARDPRVRDDHASREGKRFRWSEPPTGGHPGKAILCRCYAEPVLPDDIS